MIDGEYRQNQTEPAAHDGPRVSIVMVVKDRPQQGTKEYADVVMNCKLGTQVKTRCQTQ